MVIEIPIVKKRLEQFRKPDQEVFQYSQGC